MRIQSYGAPIKGAHWSYGADYMCRIGKATALKLCGMYPMPRMGYEVAVAIARDAAPLMVQNISGDYYLASTSDSIDRWPAVYGITILPAREG